MSAHSRTLTPAEQQLIDDGFARLYRGRLIPIMRGGDETEEEKKEREAAEAKAKEGGDDKKFTQADLDRVVQERLARDRKDRPSDDEVKELRDAKKRLDEIEEQSKTDLEKANARAEKAEKEREEARAQAKETALRSAILAEASKADRKVVDPDAVLTLLDKSALTLDNDGVPTNIAEAMDALLEKRPYLVGSGGNTTRTQGAADQGARGGGKEQLASTDGMSSDEIATAVAEGRLNDYLSSPK